jgi:hypothetical protein
MSVKSYFAPTNNTTIQPDSFETSQIIVPGSKIINVTNDSNKSYDSLTNIQQYFKRLDDNIVTNISKTFDDDDWWSNTFYPSLTAKSKLLSETLPKYISSYSTDFFEYVSKTIIELSNANNAYDTRNTLLRFLKTSLPTTLYRLLNKYKPSSIDEDKLKEDKFFILLESFGNVSMSKYSNAIRNILSKYTLNVDTVLIESNHSEDVVIKNVSLLAYILLCVLNDLVSLTKDVDATRVLCSTVELLISSLVKKLVNNDSNLELLRKTLDELREKKKQELMDSYNADDEERELQMLLKKIGIVTWTDTGLPKEDAKESKVSQQIDGDISKHHAIEEEEENYKLKGFQGENDDNDDNDDDYGIVFN